MAKKNLRPSILTDVAFGLLAGAFATFVMDQVSGCAYQLEDEKTRKQEEEIRHQEYPPELLASKLVRAVNGADLDKEEKQKYGKAIHWAYGIGWGGMYGALRGRVPFADAASGVAFGLGLWLIGDELVVPALDLSPPSAAFPWQNHARAAANHLAYGSTLGLSHSLLRKISE